MEKQGQAHLCAICRKKVADKTNSHLIPSSFISRIAGVGLKPRRGKEILYTLGTNLTSLYVGPEVLREELNDTFDSPDTEDISNYQKHDVAKDYIFCSDCEKDLNTFIEAPYSAHLYQNKKVSADISYMFWLSILWRIASFEVLPIHLPEHIIASMRNRLFNYIEARRNNDSTSRCIQKPPFRYKILKYDAYDYSKDTSMVSAEYFKKDGIALLSIYSLHICFFFKEKCSLQNIKDERVIRSLELATHNDGSQIEVSYNINKTIHEHIVALFMKKSVSSIIESRTKYAEEMWNRLYEKDKRITPDKRKAFIQCYSNKLLSQTKPGEFSKQSFFHECLIASLNEVYGLRFNN